MFKPNIPFFSFAHKYSLAHWISIVWENEQKYFNTVLDHWRLREESTFLHQRPWSKPTYFAVVSNTNMLTKLLYSEKKLLLLFENRKNPRTAYKTTKNNIKISMSMIGGNDWNICLMNRLTPPRWCVSIKNIGLSALVTRMWGVWRNMTTNTSISITTNVMPCKSDIMSEFFIRQSNA